MSAEAFVGQVISQALAVAAQKSNEASSFANQAVSASSGFASFSPQSIVFNPGNIEPVVSIPRSAAGVDSALYNSTYGQIVGDLTAKFSQFFTDYFPNECDYLTAAQRSLCDMLNGGRAIPLHVEDQIWQRDRSRVLNEVGRVQQEIIAGSAARGFPLPSGAAQYAIHMAQQDAQNKIAQQSRDVAIKHVDILIDNIKFAVQNALDYRIKGIQAAGDYIKTIALGPELATRLATSAAGAQAQLISAASQYYRNRISVEELKLEVAKFNADARNDVGMNDVREFSNRLRARAETLAAAARAAGDQAAAALNAVHASAQVAVQGETA